MRECIVCLEEFTNFVTLRCGHELCAVCYPKVMKCGAQCPLCECPIKETLDYIELQEEAIVDLDTPPRDPSCDCFFRAFCAVFAALTGYSIYLSVHLR